MKIREQIKNELRKYLVEQQIYDERIKDILVRRIPFIKEYNIVSEVDDTALKAQRVIFNSNVKVIMGDEILVFPQYNVSSDIYYYDHKVNDNVFHNFIVKNNFHVGKPNGMDDLTFRVFILAIQKLEAKLSYRNEIMIKENTQLSKIQLDQVINDMNKILFQIEEFTEKHQINLF